VQQNYQNIAVINYSYYLYPDKTNTVFQMLINCTDSPTSEWTEKKLSDAKDSFGLIEDVSLPKVNDKMTDEDIDLLADESFENIMLIFDETDEMSKPQAVFLDEELALDIRIRERLEAIEIHCIGFEEI